MGPADDAMRAMLHRQEMMNQIAQGMRVHEFVESHLNRYEERRLNPAKRYYDDLNEWISEIELEDGEFCALFYHSPAGERLQVTDISYQGPDMIVLYTLDADQIEGRVFININALQLILKILHHNDNADEKKRRPIGFIDPDSGDEQS